MEKIKICSLFSGIGGFETGILMSKFFKNIEFVFSSEIDPYARKGYELLYHQVPAGDITKINEKDVPNHDILVGGFPCQAFSISGKRQGFRDTRGTLFFDIARIAREKQPKYLFLENVKGLLNHDKGNTFRIILETLSDLGYMVDFDVFTSTDFLVPQKRERIFIIAKRSDGEKVREWEKKSEVPAVNKAKKELNKNKSISPFDFPFPKRKKASLTFQSVLEKNPDKKYTVSEEKKKRLISQIIDPLLKDEIFLIDDQGRRKKKLKKLTICPTIRREMHGNEPKVVTVKKGNISIRRLTPLECFRLQGFPDTYYKILKKEGISDTQLYKLAGNAVTTNVVQHIFEKIIEEMQKND